MSYTYTVVLAVNDVITIPELTILNNASDSHRAYGYTYFEWHCTKWGEQYEDVKKLNEWLDDLDIEELEEHYYLIMKGEELDDVSSRGWDWDSQVWLDVVTPKEATPVSIYDYKLVIIGFLVAAILILV